MHSSANTTCVAKRAAQKEAFLRQAIIEIFCIATLIAALAFVARIDAAEDNISTVEENVARLEKSLRTLEATTQQQYDRLGALLEGKQ